MCEINGAVVGDRSRDMRNVVRNSDRFNLFLHQQPTTNFDWRMPSASLHQQKVELDYLFGKDFKQDWDNRLNYRLLEVLKHSC